MVSPRHYTVDPMLSASGNLFKCHKEVLFIYFTCCIGIPIEYILFVPQLPSLERPKGTGIASSSFKKIKNNNNNPRSESNPGFQSAREMFARISRGFIHARGIPMGSKFGARPKGEGDSFLFIF